MTLLLKHGANPNEPDASGVTPLHYAAEVGTTEIVRALVSHKANVNVLDTLGSSPLDVAAFKVKNFYLFLFSNNYLGSH